MLSVRTAGGEELRFVASVNLRMMRPAKMLEDEAVGFVTFAYAPAWFDVMLLTGSREYIRQRVKETIDDMLVQFAADYYKQNPQ